MANKRKRARTEPGSSLENSALPTETSKGGMTRHSDLWFDDGSVVLVAERVGFRVHRSTLSAQSSVFADMFRVPQPSNATSIDGCPVVEITDSATETTYLMKALYHSSCFDVVVQEGQKLKLDEVVGILRLSAKYDMPIFRSKCLNELKKCFPTTLNALTECNSHRRMHLEYSVSNLIQAVAVAREAHALEISPGMCYTVCEYSPDAIALAVEEDRSGLQEAFNCLTARNKILKDQKDYTLSFLYDHTRVANCFRPDTCLQLRVRWLKDHLMMNQHLMVRAMDELKDWIRLQFTPPCRTCIPHMVSAHLAGRIKCWELLPTWFGLGTWDELEATQATHA